MEKAEKKQKEEEEKDRIFRQAHDCSFSNKEQIEKSEKCGGCQLQGISYEEQLEQKQKKTEELIGPYCRVFPICGMEDPYHYRNKVHAVLDHKKGKVISGIYAEGSHRVGR